jgi:hypothetical protein
MLEYIPVIIMIISYILYGILGLLAVGMIVFALFGDLIEDQLKLREAKSEMFDKMNKTR